MGEIREAGQRPRRTRPPEDDPSLFQDQDLEIDSSGRITGTLAEVVALLTVAAILRADQVDQVAVSDARMLVALAAHLDAVNDAVRRQIAERAA